MTLKESDDSLEFPRANFSGQPLRTSLFVPHLTVLGVEGQIGLASITLIRIIAIVLYYSFMD